MKRSISVGVLMHDLASRTAASSNNSLRNDLCKIKFTFSFDGQLYSDVRSSQSTAELRVTAAIYKKKLMQSQVTIFS